MFDLPDWIWQGTAVAMAIGLPIYVCSSASVPIVAGFIHLGASPGAVVIASDEEGLLVHVNQEGDERFARLVVQRHAVLHRRQRGQPVQRAAVEKPDDA